MLVVVAMVVVLMVVCVCAACHAEDGSVEKENFVKRMILVSRGDYSGFEVVWCLVDGGLWMVVGGWWLVGGQLARGWWLVDNGPVVAGCWLLAWR